MKRWHTSIGGLMFVVLWLAVVSAALTRPTRLWAAALYTLGFALVFLAAIAAVYGSRERRPFRVGFAIASGAYLVLRTVLPALATHRVHDALSDVAIDVLYQRMHPREVPIFGGDFDVDSKLNLVIAGRVGGAPAAANGWFDVFLMDPNRSAWTTPIPPFTFARIAHCAIGLLSGVVGGVIANWLAARRARETIEASGA